MSKPSDYQGLAHPPIIGYGLDGHPLHGRHTTTGLDGESIDLDTCGGHEHGGTYHYHATVTQDRTTDKLDGVPGNGPFQYTTYDLAPAQCWKGDVSEIPAFWEPSGRQVNYDRSKGPADPTSWSDFQFIRPCCGTTEAILATGITLDGYDAAQPSPSPTAAPVKSPTAAPVKSPTAAPVKSPTAAPVKSPTAAPVKSPTAAPAPSPTNAPACGDANDWLKIKSNGNQRTCEWVAEKPDKRCKKKANTDPWDGVKAKKACLDTCGKCDQLRRRARQI